MIIAFKNIVATLLAISSILWILLTIFVLIALAGKWVHPATKSISSLDLKYYFQVSAVFIGLFILLKLTLNFIKSKLEKRS